MDLASFEQYALCVHLRLNRGLKKLRPLWSPRALPKWLAQTPKLKRPKSKFKSKGHKFGSNLISKVRDCSDGTDAMAGHLVLVTTGPSRKFSG